MYFSYPDNTISRMYNTTSSFSLGKACSQGITCKNGGTCQDGSNGFQCHCSHKFSGEFCETRMLKKLFIAI